MFKVLAISYYFPPMGLSGVQRTLKFMKYLPQFNWQPTVITTGKTGYFAHDYSLLAEAENSGIEIVRTEAVDPNSLLKGYGSIRMPGEFTRKMLSRLSKTFFIPDNKISWSRKAYKVASEILKKENFDIIYVTIPPYSAFTAAAKLKKKFDIPLFVDYRDLWYGNHFAFYPTPYHRIRHKKGEDEALRQADKIIVINRRIKEFLLKTYPFLTFEDIIILPQGFDPEDLNIEFNKGKKGKMKMTYSGIFYENITPRYFLKAFKQLSVERPDITANIELHFTGLLRKENLKLIRRYGLQEFVHDHGYMEHRESLKKVMESDILWMMIDRISNADSISTGKLFEYFGTGKPILACVPEGAALSAAKEYGAGYIAPPSDIEAIKNLIIKIHEDFKNDTMPVPNQEFIARHDRKYLTEQLSKQFQFYLKEL